MAGGGCHELTFKPFKTNYTDHSRVFRTEYIKNNFTFHYQYECLVYFLIYFNFDSL